MSSAAGRRGQRSRRSRRIGLGAAPIMDVIPSPVAGAGRQRMSAQGRMRGVATDIGTIHFIGIGGIGMSGIAEVMHNLGYQVQGSDIADGYVIEGLRKRGIKVMIGHEAANVEAWRSS
jgi:hypothetical protein